MSIPSVAALTDLEGHKHRLQAAVALLPPEHTCMIIEPIIVVNRFHGGRTTGVDGFLRTACEHRSSGGARRTDVRAEDVLSRPTCSSDVYYPDLLYVRA